MLRALNGLRMTNLPKPTPWNILPPPARDLIDMAPYRNAWKSTHGYFSLNLVASRGCPYRCNWCAKPISGDKFHVRPADAVADEMLELRDTYGAEHLWFGDDVFALDHRWTTQFASEVEERHCALPFKIQSRADLMTAETVDALRRAGCAEVWMGVESGSQKILDAMDKGLFIEEVVTATRASAKCRYSRLLLPAIRIPRRRLDRHSTDDIARSRLLVPTISESRFLIRCRTRGSMTRFRRNSDASATGPTATIFA